MIPFANDNAKTSLIYSFCSFHDPMSSDDKGLVEPANPIHLAWWWHATYYVRSRCKWTTRVCQQIKLVSPLATTCGMVYIAVGRARQTRSKPPISASLSLAFTVRVAGCLEGEGELRQVSFFVNLTCSLATG